MYITCEATLPSEYFKDFKRLVDTTAMLAALVSLPIIINYRIDLEGCKFNPNDYILLLIVNYY